MIKKIAIVSSCILLAFIMAINSFAISSYDSLSYWSNAQNTIGFVGTDIVSQFSYTKTSGLNPPTSIQSEFYKNGYYSNNVALFTDRAGGFASYDAFGYEDIFSWTYNGVDGTTPLDEGFALGSGNPSVTLNNQGAVLGPYDATYFKSMSYDSEKKIAIYDFRMLCSGISDNTNFSRVVFLNEYNGSIVRCILTVSNFGVGFESNFDPGDPGFGNVYVRPFTASEFHDYRVIMDDDKATLYIDGVLQRTITCAQVSGSSSTYSSGITFISQKYQTTTLYSCSGKTIGKPTSAITVNLGRDILVPSGEEMEFYIHLKSGSVTNVTQSITTDFEYNYISSMNVIFNEEILVVPIQVSDNWLLVNIPATDHDRTFTSCYFYFTTPYVNMDIGDNLRWDMQMAFSDLVIGDPKDIGYNPDVDPGENQFRNEVLGGINDVKQEIHDGFDIINGTLEDVRQEVADGFDRVEGVLGDIESELSRDDTFDDVTAWPDADIEHVIPESDALLTYDQVMAQAYQTLDNANLSGAQSWWQSVFNSVLTIPLAGMMAVIVSSLLILRALLGR